MQFSHQPNGKTQQPRQIRCRRSGCQACFLLDHHCSWTSPFPIDRTNLKTSFTSTQPDSVIMSDVQSRPSAPRGRGSGRGGRGGYGSRGGSRPSGRTTANNGPNEQASKIIEDEGEVGELKKKYSSKLATVKELFPDWTDEDVVFALQETDGDLEGTIERITEGTLPIASYRSRDE